MKTAENPRRILIIEDNLDSAETLRALLELQNHTIETAFDGRTGVEKYLTFAPEVVICDIGLPGEYDGFQVAEQIRRNAEVQTVLLIALSGYGQKEDVQQSIEAGFDFHLVKPPDFDKLFEMIERFKN